MQHVTPLRGPLPSFRANRHPPPNPFTRVAGGGGAAILSERCALLLLVLLNYRHALPPTTPPLNPRCCLPCRNARDVRDCI